MPNPAHQPGGGGGGGGGLFGLAQKMLGGLMGGGKKPANIANPGNTPTAHASPSESSSAVVSAAAPPGLINVCHSVKVKVEVIMGKR